MKDFTKEELTASHPSKEPKDSIDFCLGRLYEDETKNVCDEIVKDLTFEELIGALLQAKDTC